MSDDDGYICTLDSASKTKAREELFEDPKERSGVLETFRAWINQQVWLRTPTDTLFLLQILRARKFSQLRARELIENYWKYRVLYKERFCGSDPADPKVQELWQEGVYIPLPGRDTNGRKIVLSRMGHIDCSETKYSYLDFIRANNMVFEAMLLDENVQVNGMVILIDVTGFTMKHHTFFGLEHSKKSLEIFQNATPLRLKEIHYYNVGPVFETLFALIRPLIKEKLRKRIFMHGQSLVSLYEKIDMSMLPTEYLPDDYSGPNGGTINQMIQKSLEYMKEPHVQQWLKKIHSPEYGYDKSLKPIKDEPQASFRKLNVS